MKQKQKQNKTWQPYQTKTTFINALDGLFFIKFDDLLLLWI